MTSSLTMEVEAVTYAIQWLASQHDAQITHAIIVTDSMNLLQKMESGMGCPDWHTAVDSLRLQRLLWIYCPGHAGVSGNERADRLASTADITSGLQLGRAEVLRSLRNFLNMDSPEHHSTDRLKERGVEKGSGQHSTIQGREGSVFNQANIGTVSRATLGRLLRDGAECIWAFPSATIPSWAETETETDIHSHTAIPAETVTVWQSHAALPHCCPSPLAVTGFCCAASGYPPPAASVTHITPVIHLSVTRTIPVNQLSVTQTCQSPAHYTSNLFITCHNITTGHFHMSTTQICQSPSC